jgi:hypothetical protein
MKLRCYGLGDLSPEISDWARRPSRAPLNRPAPATLLKPITWFAPMWAFGWDRGLRRAARRRC